MSTPLDQFAGLITRHHEQALSTDVIEATRRTLYNGLATAVGASREPAMDVVLATASSFRAGNGIVPGRVERLHPMDAALATGIAAHLDDYDDTHLSTVIHPAAVCLATVVGLQDDIADRDDNAVLSAFAWGVEAQLRLGVAVSPEHYDAGWHITGTCGTVGAAVTAGLLLGLDSPQLRVALEWAVERGVGNREGFGSMTKPFHPGKAAIQGIRAACDASTGASGPGDTLTGPDGFVARLANGKFDEHALLAEMGQRWELLDNTFKPYPCGIVSHPAIEAAEALHERVAEHGGPDAVTAIRLVCHPLVPELTGTVQPSDGLQARFSTAHGVAAGLLKPVVDLSGYNTEFVVSAPTRRLRSLVTFEATPDCARDAAFLEVTLDDGSTLDHQVVHARGSLARPLSDDELHAKAAGLVDHILTAGSSALDGATRHEGAGYVRRLLDSCAVSGPPPAATTTRPSKETEEQALVDYLVYPSRPNVSQHATDLNGLVADALRLRASTRDDDERDRAGAVAAGLVESGHRTAAAAAVAACGELSPTRAEHAVSMALTACSALATRLGVPTDRLSTLAATFAASIASGPCTLATSRAIGLAATETTTVLGSVSTPVTDATRVRHATADGVEAAALARHGFTAPEQPLTGRRGLLSIMGINRTPSLAELATDAESR